MDAVKDAPPNKYKIDPVEEQIEYFIEHNLDFEEPETAEYVTEILFP